jgi:hypothetical protein
MPDTIHFTLHNNYSDDVVVVVNDMYGGVARQTWSGPLNKDETTSIEVYANSDGRGAARRNGLRLGDRRTRRMTSTTATLASSIRDVVRASRARHRDAVETL